MPVNEIKDSFAEYSKKYPNVELKPPTAPMVDFENVVLKTILAKGDIPDLYYLTGGSWQLRNYIEAGDYAVDLTPSLFPQYGGLTEGDWGFDFIPSFFDVNRIWGKYYVIPFGMRLTSLMISKKIPDSAVSMSPLADHRNVQFNFYRGGIGTCKAETH